MDRCTAYPFWPHMEAQCGRVVLSVTNHLYGGYVEDSSVKFSPRCYEHLWGYDRLRVETRRQAP